MKFQPTISLSESSLFTAIQPTLLYKDKKNWRPLPDERYATQLGWMRREEKNKNKSSERRAMDGESGKDKVKSLKNNLCVLSRKLLLLHGVCASYSRPGKTAENS